MGFFRRSDPQQAFEGTGFTITETIFTPPPLSLLPTIYADDASDQWAVRLPGQRPSIFKNDDMLQCSIVEREPTNQEGLSRRERAWNVLSNPSAVSRENAARKGSCLGLSVIVWVRTPNEGMGSIELPIVTREMPRDSSLFVRLQDYAQQLKRRFDALRD